MTGRNVNRGRHLPAEIYDRATIAALFAACGRGFYGARNRALLAVLYHAGLRVEEALSLQTHDVLFDVRGVARLHIRSGKGSKQRVAVLRPDGVPFVRRWIEKRERRGSGPLFIDSDGNALGTAAVRMLLPRLARKAGVQQRVHAHGFRHTHAFELMNGRVPTPFIQRQLGHSRLSVTEQYLNHVSPDALVDAVLAAS